MVTLLENAWMLSITYNGNQNHFVDLTNTLCFLHYLLKARPHFHHYRSMTEISTHPMKSNCRTFQQMAWAHTYAIAAQHWYANVTPREMENFCNFKVKSIKQALPDCNSTFSIHIKLWLYGWQKRFNLLCT